LLWCWSCIRQTVFSEALEGGECGCVCGTAERLQRAGDDHRFVQGALSLFEPACEPAHCVAGAAVPVTEADKRRELERLAHVERAEVAGLKFSHDEVPALDRSAEGGSGVPLGSRDVLLSWGRTGRAYRSRKERPFGLTSGWAQALRERVERGRVQ
jgi:hypothetical protein